MAPGRPVLVTDERWRKGLSAVRALGRRGVRVLTVDSTRLVAARWSRYVARHLVLPAPATAAEAFVSGIIELAAREPGLVVFPMEDVTLSALAGVRARLGSVMLPIPTTEAIDVALDKQATTARAQALGIPTPRTADPADATALAEAVRHVGLPLVVKPRRGWGSQGVAVVEQPELVEPTYRRIAASFPRPILQERIPPGGRAFGVSCLFNMAGELRATFVHQRLREYPRTGGPSTLRVSVERPDLVAQSARLLTSLGWRGFAMVEWKTDPRDGVPRLLEVNPRFVGSLELALVSGVDFPWLLYQVATTGDCPLVETYRVGQLCRWLLPGDLLHFLSNPDRWRLEPSFFRFRRPDLAYDDWAGDDPLPSLVQVGLVGLQALRPAMWRYVVTRSTPLPG